MGAGKLDVGVPIKYNTVEHCSAWNVLQLDWINVHIFVEIRYCTIAL